MIVRVYREERLERGPRGPFVSSGEGTATSKFGNCFLDWLGRSGSLICLFLSHVSEIIEYSRRILRAKKYYIDGLEHNFCSTRGWKKIR